MIKRFRSLVVCSIVVLAVPSGATAQSCAAGPATVQILGSGGPFINRDRASASYLLWVGGQARMLVDIGGGTIAEGPDVAGLFLNRSPTFCMTCSLDTDARLESPIGDRETPRL
jgi:hypothetical protein